MLKNVLFTANCQFRPDDTVSPGEYLVNCLQVRGISQTKFASGCGCTPRPFGETIDGMEFTDAETALLINQRTSKKRRPPQGRTSGQRYSRWGGMCSVQHDRLNRQNDARGVFMASGQKRNAPRKGDVGPTILSLGGCCYCKLCSTDLSRLALYDTGKANYLFESLHPTATN